MEDPQTDLDINCKSQLSLLEACRENNPDARIVFAASRQQYGRPQFVPVTEEHPLVPVDVNGINLIAGERYHLLYNDVHGIRAVSLRLTNTYGPHLLMKHGRQGFITVFIRLALEGERHQGVRRRHPAARLHLRLRRRRRFPRRRAVRTAYGQALNVGGSSPCRCSRSRACARRSPARGERWRPCRGRKSGRRSTSARSTSTTRG